MNQYRLHIKNTVVKTSNTVVVLFIIIYLVGVAGISINYTSEFFTGQIPAIILLSLFTCLIFHRPAFDKRTVTVFLSIVIISFFIEAAAVKYGFIFGKYSYGTSLGLSVLNTPLIIGLNWLSLVYCTVAVTENLRQHVIIKILVASFLMLVYDLLLEISAPVLDMWSFEDGIAPVRNYLAWLVIAAFFQSALKIARIRIINPTAQKIFLIQLLFFIMIAILR
jgi:putative membrane protein